MTQEIILAVVITFIITMLLTNAFITGRLTKKANNGDTIDLTWEHCIGHYHYTKKAYIIYEDQIEALQNKQANLVYMNNLREEGTSHYFITLKGAYFYYANTDCMYYTYYKRGDFLPNVNYALERILEHDFILEVKTCNT